MSYTITVNFETQNGVLSPMPLAKYVRTLDTNPVSIEEGGTATLDFVADGMYYTLLRGKALAAKVTGASFTWSCPEPYTYGKMILSNPTDNVVITLRAKVNILPQEVTRPFLINGQFPIDTRLILSKAEMLDKDGNQITDITKAYWMRLFLKWIWLWAMLRGIIFLKRWK